MLVAWLCTALPLLTACYHTVDKPERRAFPPQQCYCKFVYVSHKLYPTCHHEVDDVAVHGTLPHVLPVAGALLSQQAGQGAAHTTAQLAPARDQNQQLRAGALDALEVV
jgi:hypothetical protein